MEIFRAALLLCVIATSSPRSVPVDGEAETNTMEQINIEWNIDSEEFSKFLRCSACLSECLRIRESESFFLCKSCLKSCTNQTDAFMHFFSSHRCSIIQSTPSGELATEKPQIVAKPKSTSNEDYVDQYMDKKYFSDKCEVTKQNFRDMELELNKCQIDLGNCNSDWYDGPYEQEGSDEPKPTQVDTINHPENGPDGEKSAVPPTTRQTATFKALEDDVEIHNFTKEEIADIIEKFKSMFVTKQEYEEMTSLTWGGKSIHNLKTKGRKEACPVDYEVEAPFKAELSKGKLSVQVLQSDKYKQPFIIARCADRRPTVHGLDAECRTVHVRRSALVLRDERKKHLFKNCFEHNGGKYICKEWINAAGACSLFV